MKNFSDLNAEIKKQKKIYARLDNESGRKTANWKAVTFRLALLTYWKRQGIGLPGNYKQLWNPPANCNPSADATSILKARTPLHRWEAWAIRSQMIATAMKKIKGAKSPLTRWMVSDEIKAKLAELDSRPVF